MLLQDIHIRDPFVLVDGGKYYMYGTRGVSCWGKASGFDVYVSEDLATWDGPTECFSTPEGFWSDMNYWAPEVHAYQGKYYMFASFKSPERCRATQILVADVPTGPFRVHSEPITPADWECLDGTLYVEDGTPYMVFCHEWVQVGDGEVCAVRMSEDLKKAVSEPMLLFKASDLPDVEEVGEPGRYGYVTDGPFMYRTEAGSLLMIWSSFTKEGYCEAVARSESGTVAGPWKQEKMLYTKDGGHGMFFRRMSDNTLCFVCHKPNKTPDERPVFAEVAEENDTLTAR